MAKATVQKIVITEEEYTLKLSKREALYLLALTGATIGSSTSNHHIYNALYEVFEESPVKAHYFERHDVKPRDGV